jgi:translation initiation factor IF-3
MSSLLAGLPRRHQHYSRGVAVTCHRRLSVVDDAVSSTMPAAVAVMQSLSSSTNLGPLPLRRYINNNSNLSQPINYYGVYSLCQQIQQWHFSSRQLRRLSTTPSSSSSSSSSTPQRTKGDNSSGGSGGSNNANKANGGKTKGGGANKNNKQGGRGGRGRDTNILINEHLIAELFNRHRHQQQQQQQQGNSSGDYNNNNNNNKNSSTTVLTAETYEVRLIIDRGRERKNSSTSSSTNSNNGRSDEDEVDGESTTDDDDSDSEDDDNSDDDSDEGDDDDDDDNDDDKAEGEAGNSHSEPSSSTSTTLESPTPALSSTSTTSSTSSSTAQLTTLDKAITIAHEYSLDLIGITLSCYPPVIKAVNYDRHVYELKKRLSKVTSTKKKEGKGAISDRSLKEYKFRAGIAHHDLVRKTSNMIKYLEKGHAIRVTLTARQRSIKEDADAISTTLDRVRELVGDKAIEVKKLTANERNSYGSLLLHPAK